jgi:hypothetical protein
MLRKISFAILSVAILVTGVIALRKLNYLDSSIWVFKLSSDKESERRIGHGFGEGAGRGRSEGFERSTRPGERPERPPMRELPDSIRGRFAGRGRGQGIRERNFTDSLRHEFPPEFRERGERIPPSGDFRNHNGRGRGDFREGRKINLSNVLWFLAVFASLTVITIYIDKAIKLICRKKKSRQSQ